MSTDLLDVELSAIAEHLPHLEQLSIMGTRNVTTRAVIVMAQALTSLKLLDVGYCEQVDQDYFQSRHNFYFKFRRHGLAVRRLFLRCASVS